MPNPNTPPTPINVNVNFNGVTCVNAVWSGTPTWNVNPSPANIPPSRAGNTTTLQFNLNASALPSGFTAAFASPNAIVFAANQNWPGGPPSSPNSTTVTMDDTFNNNATNVDYKYSINVTLSGNQGTAWLTHTFTLDPDVVNEAGSVVVANQLTHTAK